MKRKRWMIILIGDILGAVAGYYYWGFVGDFEPYETQIQIQHLLFPKGLLFDEEVDQFSEID